MTYDPNKFNPDSIYLNAEMRQVGPSFVLRCLNCKKFISAVKVWRANDRCYHCGIELKRIGDMEFYEQS